MFTPLPLGTDRVRLKTALTVPLFPSVTLTSLTETEGMGSSSVIITTPESWIVALVGFERTTPKSSSFSSRLSLMIGMLIVCVVIPGENVSVPDVDV
jgi:hypothetical protein